MFKFTRLILLSCIILSASQLQAQKGKAEKINEFRDVAVFVGMWESNATITIDTVPHPVTYRMNFRRTADSYGINMDEAYTDSALGDMRGSSLLGYGYEDKKIHWYHVDNMGATYESIGQWNDLEHLYFSSTVKKGDKTYNEIITYAFNGNDEFTLKHSYYVDGKEIKKITGKFTRKKFAAPKGNKE